MIKTLDKKKCKDEINNNIIDKYIENTISPLTSQENPICVINVGGPGSGKTYVSKLYR
jgi:hypothetical protein